MSKNNVDPAMNILQLELIGPHQNKRSMTTFVILATRIQQNQKLKQNQKKPKI